MIKKLKTQLDLIDKIEDIYIKNSTQFIEIGDSIKIKKLIQEVNKERIQTSDGVVIAKKNSKLNKTITVRKIMQNVGVERVYLINSPKILSIEIIKKAKVRKSKLYYLRNKLGKASKLKQKF